MTKKKNTRRSPKRRRRNSRSPKRLYRNRNWREYNAALVQRGSLTVWVEEQALRHWFSHPASGRRGASCTYSDAAITMVLTLGAVYGLTLRATQGFVVSILKLMRLQEALPVPHYSTLSRRQAQLEVALPRRKGQEALHVVMDSTGCKIFGEGEWKVRQHGWSKRRTWRKLHLAVDEASGLILQAELTTPDVGDGEVAADLIPALPEPIQQFSGDGHYDTRGCYQALARKQQRQAQRISVTVPPRAGARIWRHGNSKEQRLARDENLRRIRQVGKAKWKEESGYHRRSLAETTIFRYKAIFGDKLSSRSFEGQATEAFIRCRALNRMTELGMPDHYVVTAP